MNNESLRYLIQHLQYAENETDDTVFKWGARGDLFYIMYEGMVEVRVPAEIEVEISPDNFLLYLLDHYKLICWKKTHNGKEIANLIIDEYKYQSETEEKVSVEEMVDFLRAKLAENKTKIH
jgi:hypothetical protein